MVGKSARDGGVGGYYCRKKGHGGAAAARPGRSSVRGSGRDAFVRPVRPCVRCYCAKSPPAPPAAFSGDTQPRPHWRFRRAVINVNRERRARAYKIRSPGPGEWRGSGRANLTNHLWAGDCVLYNNGLYYIVCIRVYTE